MAPLLLVSGACALAYQTAWMRQFRLVFGASTAATAAVVAVFMGGLGIGGWILGPRADRHPSPLVFYARLEALVAGVKSGFCGTDVGASCITLPTIELRGPTPKTTNRGADGFVASLTLALTIASRNDGLAVCAAALLRTANFVVVVMVTRLASMLALA